jgi:uncharacterized delta-60 repeat protein
VNASRFARPSLALVLVVVLLGLAGCAPAGTTTGTAPAAASGLTATAATSSRIDLAWTDNSSDETGFTVERSADGAAGWFTRAKTSAGVVEFQDLDLASGTAYFYRVSASNDAGSSAPTDVASAATFVPGALDPYFGAGGKATARVGSGAESPATVLVLADGKLLVAGTSTDGIYNHFSLARFGADGAVDSSFGSGGGVLVPLSTANKYEVCRAAALQSDGDIVAVGGVLGNSYLGVLRFTADGAPDATFGTAGLASTSLSSSNDYANGVTIQSDGKIVAVGCANSGESGAPLLRFGAGGTPDTGFGTSGVVQVSVSGNTWVELAAVTMQYDGKIVAVGYTKVDAGSTSDMILVRCASDGTLDASFNGTGMVTTDAGVTDDDRGLAVAIQRDGKIVVAGYAGPSLASGTGRGFVARFTTAGALDTGFGSGGIAYAPGSGNTWFTTIGIQADGRILAGGAVDNGTDNDFAIVRFGSAGAPDTAFGTGGMAVTDFGGGADVASSLAVQSDGLIVLTGQAGTTGAIGLARYEP